MSNREKRTLMLYGNELSSNVSWANLTFKCIIKEIVQDIAGDWKEALLDLSAP